MKTYKINRQVYEVSDEKFDRNTRIVLSEKSTLRQVKEMVTSTRRITKAPSANYLRCCEDVVAAITAAGSRIEVYQNGFAVYQTPYRAVVVRMDYVGNVWYEGDPGLERGRQNIDLSDEQWAIAVMMSAEDRLERWRRMRDDATLISLCVAGEMDEETGERGEMEVDAGVDVEESFISEERRKELWREIKKLLSKRQREMIELFYRECLTQREIADFLGIDFTTVSRTLMRAKENLKRKFNCDF